MIKVVILSGIHTSTLSCPYDETMAARIQRDLCSKTSFIAVGNTIINKSQITYISFEEDEKDKERM